MKRSKWDIDSFWRWPYNDKGRSYDCTLKNSGYKWLCYVITYDSEKVDYEPFEDIDYNSYKGRLLDLAINIYGENSYPTRKLFYFNNTNFYGEDHVSGADVLSWMLNILYFEDYKHTSEENFKERAIKVGLIEPIEYIRREITAKDLKNL